MKTSKFSFCGLSFPHSLKKSDYIVCDICRSLTELSGLSILPYIVIQYLYLPVFMTMTPHYLCNRMMSKGSHTCYQLRNYRVRNVTPPILMLFLIYLAEMSKFSSCGPSFPHSHKKNSYVVCQVSQNCLCCQYIDMVIWQDSQMVLIGVCDLLLILSFLPSNNLIITSIIY